MIIGWFGILEPCSCICITWSCCGVNWIYNTRTGTWWNG